MASTLQQLGLDFIQCLTPDYVSSHYGVTLDNAHRMRGGVRPIINKILDDAYIWKLGDLAAQASPGTVLQPECSWEGKRLALLLPWYKTVNPVTALSLLAMLDRQKMGVIMSHGDAYIAHSRDSLAQQFLKTSCEWALMVDDDMIIPFGNPAAFNAHTGFNLPREFAGIHTINRLVTQNKTLIGGLYFGRQKRGKPMYAEGIAYLDEAAAARRAPVDQVKPTKWVATGCMLIHRRVFLDIDAKFPELKQRYFSPSEHELLTASRDAQDLLTKGDTDGASAALSRGLELSGKNSPLGLGEDVTFCVRAAAAGHQPHVDMAVVCGHIGTEVYGPQNTET